MHGWRTPPVLGAFNRAKSFLSSVGWVMAIAAIMNIKQIYLQFGLLLGFYGFGVEFDPAAVTTTEAEVLIGLLLSRLVHRYDMR